MTTGKSLFVLENWQWVKENLQKTTIINVGWEWYNSELFIGFSKIRKQNVWTLKKCLKISLDRSISNDNR